MSVAGGTSKIRSVPKVLRATPVKVNPWQASKALAAAVALHDVETVVLVLVEAGC